MKTEDVKTGMKVEQQVVRTFANGYARENSGLRQLLSQGYKVVHITRLSNDDIEYIVEVKK